MFVTCTNVRIMDAVAVILGLLLLGGTGYLILKVINDPRLK